MRCRSIVVLAAVWTCGSVVSAHAEDQGRRPPSAVSAPALTPEQFQALPPTADIEVDGRRTSKAEFLMQRENDFRKVFADMKAKRSRVAADFAAHRAAFLDGEKTKLDAANKPVLAEVDRLRSADAALHGPDWEARREQALALLKHAAAVAEPVERARLEKQAADLLAPVSPKP